MPRPLLPFAVAMLLGIPFSHAQEEQPMADTVKVYGKLEKAAQRTWFTTAIYDLFFKPVAFHGDRDDLYYRKLAVRPYETFEGLPVRHIRIQSLDPFGFDVYDTLSQPRLGTERFGNALHFKTRERTVRNLLMFQQGQAFDSLLVKESERLLRQELYVQEVFFFPTLGGESLDSVDVLIRVLDSWSIIPEIGFSPTRFSYGLTEHNMVGLNHVLYGYHTYNHALDRHAVQASYTVRNITRSYINTQAVFRREETGDWRLGAIADRPFYSAVTRWAGGAMAFYQFRTDTLYLPGQPTQFVQTRSLPMDYWAARAFQLFGGRSEDDRATNLIVSAGLNALAYTERPAGELRKLDIYRDRAFFRAGIGISTRKYVRDRYIFNYGFIEDVPIGRSYGIVAGYDLRGDPRWHVGAHWAWGHYYRWGYFSTRLEYGNFIRHGRYEEGLVRGSISYFTGLLELGRWKFRQFVKPELTIGLARLPTDNLTLNEGRGGIRGFNSAELSGIHRILITLQTQSYAPWRLIGFQFGPYLTCSMGMLGTAEDGFSNSRPYWMLGLGFLINNRYLVFENFEVSLAFYPFIPGTGERNGRNVLLGNAFRTTDFGFPDFGLGRPGVAEY